MEPIIKKYLEGIATEKEQRSLLEWLRDRKNRALFNKVKSDWRENMDVMSFTGEGEQAWNKLQEKLWQKNFQLWKISERMQHVLRYAAVFLLIIAVGSLTYIFTNRPEKIPFLNTSIVADNGQISKVELPDGSTLWLNSGSEIIYNNHFATNNREIILNGEAYFLVSKNTELPFIVKCDQIQVKAVGTQFNVYGYPGSGFVEVVLEDGSVELRHKEKTDFSYVLKPGEMASFRISDGKFNVAHVNTLKYTSWKDGIINIYDQPISEVVKRLELRYNQKFTFEDGMKDFRYTFSIENESLEEIIRLMEKITPVKAIQMENTIVFKMDKNKAKNAE